MLLESSTPSENHHLPLLNCISFSEKYLPDVRRKKKAEQNAVPTCRDLNERKAGYSWNRWPQARFGHLLKAEPKLPSPGPHAYPQPHFSKLQTFVVIYWGLRLLIWLPTEQRVIWEGSLSWGIFQIKLAHGYVCWGLSWWLIDVGKPSPVWVALFPGKMVLCCVSKLAKHGSRSEPASSIPPGFRLQVPAEFLPWFPSVIDYNLEANESFTPLLLVTVFYHGNRMEPRTKFGTR